MRTKIYLLSIIILFFTISINAQTSIKNRYNKLRFDDNFSFLQNDSLKGDFFDPIKYIPLSSNPNVYLSMGGEIRHNYKLYKNDEWQPTLDENGHFQHRYMFHTDFHLGNHLRVFSQVNSGLTYGRVPEPTAIIDENQFEVNQLFLEYVFGDRNKDFHLGIRVGRMEEMYGTARFIATREGQNVRRSFDGIHVFLGNDKWEMDVFALKQIVSMPGVFDDFRDPGESIYGAVLHTKGKGGIHYEPYVIINRDLTGLLFEVDGEEWHVTPGARIFKNDKNLSWNVESAIQFGGFQDEKVFGYLVAGSIGYKFTGAKSNPYVGFKFNYSTGDSDGRPGGLGTFEPFFPKAVLGQASVINPANLIQFHLETSFNLFKNSRIILSHDQLFRASRSDVFYDPCGYQIVEITDDLSSARYIGHQSRIALKQRFGPHYTILIEHIIFPPGTFLTEMGRTDVLHYTSIRSVFRF